MAEAASPAPVGISTASVGVAAALQAVHKVVDPAQAMEILLGANGWQVTNTQGDTVPASEVFAKMQELVRVQATANQSARLREAIVKEANGDQKLVQALFGLKNKLAGNLRELTLNRVLYISGAKPIPEGKQGSDTPLYTEEYDSAEMEARALHFIQAGIEEENWQKMIGEFYYPDGREEAVMTYFTYDNKKWIGQKEISKELTAQIGLFDKKDGADGLDYEDVMWVQVGNVTLMAVANSVTGDFPKMDQPDGVDTSDYKGKFFNWTAVFWKRDPQDGKLKLVLNWDCMNPNIFTSYIATHPPLAFRVMRNALKNLFRG